MEVSGSAIVLEIIVTSVDIQWRVTDWSSADEQTKNVR
jgi:hypothetical protein